ncbi:hypothetical protein [Rhizocola hellebori]|nr:hypothetical protein [Rhizocola hellebori]
MGEQLRPDEAARALAEIGQRQEQVIRLMRMPVWFWWVTAALMVGLTAAVESRRPIVVGIGVAVFVVGLVTMVLRIVLGSIRHAKPRNDLVPPAGVMAILGFVAVVLAVTLPAGFALKATGVSYPATLSMLLAAALLVGGGPLLTRYLHRVMRANVTGGL